ncbi:MAG: ComEC/Rec2 family competence protein, partial [Planctomycetota bacterium]
GVHAACRRVLERHLEPPHAALAAAILLGDRDQLDPDQVDAFFVTGTVHLLAISGLHLAILVQAVFLVLRATSVPRPHRLALVMAVTIFYALLTGARPPVVRAAVLVCMLCLELMALRPRCSFNSLAAAGIVLLAMNPTHVFHIGVQLSFLAVATLIWMSRFERGRECRETKPSPPSDPSLRTYLGHKVRQHFRTTAIASVAIWLISLPLVAHQFHLIPLSGLVLNLFLLLPLAVALYSGLAIILLSWIPLFAGCCAWLCGHCLDVITGIVNGVSGCEFSHGWVPGPPVVGLASFYLIVLGFGAFRRFNGRWPVWLGLGFATLGLLLFCGHRKPDRGLECAFLAVGHGVCIVLELPNDEVWLYDAGSLGGVDSTLREISSFLWSRGITRLDGIVISHGDLDHFNVVPALIRRFSVRQICISPAIFQTADASMRELVAAIEREQIPVRYVARGAALSESPWGTMSVCFPDLHGFAEQDNANSVVLDIQYFQKRILLTGDLEGEGLARLLASEPLDCDIVMAPHHGSRHSRPSEVARWSRPEWVIVSGGDPRRAVEAMASYREAGARVLHTSHAGAITAVLKPGQVEVR